MDLERDGVDGVVARIRERVGDAPLYLSIDIDVLDPAHAPGTGTPEAGGLTSRELLGILRGLAGLRLVGADVVEVAPAYDHAEMTTVAAAHVAYELLALTLLAHPPQPPKRNETAVSLRSEVLKPQFHHHTFYSERAVVRAQRPVQGQPVRPPRRAQPSARHPAGGAGPGWCWPRRRPGWTASRPPRTGRWPPRPGRTPGTRSGWPPRARRPGAPARRPR